MTLAGARAILGGKLEFGNKDQIDARKFLEDVETYFEAMQACKYWHEHERGAKNYKRMSAEATEDYFDELEDCACQDVYFAAKQLQSSWIADVMLATIERIAEHANAKATR